jgi:hypothetical protein
MGLKRQHAAGHPAVLSFTVEQRQHGLMAPVHTVKVANRQRAGVGCEPRMVVAAKDLMKFVCSWGVAQLGGCPLSF